MGPGTFKNRCLVVEAVQKPWKHQVSRLELKIQMPTPIARENKASQNGRIFQPSFFRGYGYVKLQWGIGLVWFLQSTTANLPRVFRIWKHLVNQQNKHGHLSFTFPWNDQWFKRKIHFQNTTSPLKSLLTYHPPPSLVASSHPSVQPT